VELRKWIVVLKKRKMESNRMLAKNFKIPSQAEYLNSNPFPHCVINDLWDKNVISSLASSVESFENWDGQKEFYGSIGKRWCSSPQKLPDAVLRFINFANGPTVLKILEEITGEIGLIPDPYLEGGGIHSSTKGGFLKMHADFNWHEKMKVVRRLNLLVYLNSGWQKSWGGDLQLASKSAESGFEISKSIFPEINKTVLFTTDETSFHGHPDPLNCPEGVSRNSIALYYYVSHPSDKDNFRIRSGTDYVSSSGSKISLLEKIRSKIKKLKN
jgi:Rps23 Pro-64 3,4-dihydroxylase Tpa1-like proline 4-hydroxylase